MFVLAAPGAHSLNAVVNWHAGAWSKVWQADKPKVVDNTLLHVKKFVAEVRSGTEGPKRRVGNFENEASSGEPHGGRSLAKRAERTQWQFFGCLTPTIAAQ